MTKESNNYHSCDFIKIFNVNQLQIKQVLYNTLPKVTSTIKMFKGSFLNPHPKRISGIQLRENPLDFHTKVITCWGWLFLWTILYACKVDDILVTWYLAIFHCKRSLLSWYCIGNLIFFPCLRLHWFSILPRVFPSRSNRKAQTLELIAHKLWRRALTSSKSLSILRTELNKHVNTPYTSWIPIFNIICLLPVGSKDWGKNDLLNHQVRHFTALWNHRITEL